MASLEQQLEAARYQQFSTLQTMNNLFGPTWMSNPHPWARYAFEYLSAICESVCRIEAAMQSQNAHAPTPEPAHTCVDAIIEDVAMIAIVVRGKRK